MQEFWESDEPYEFRLTADEKSDVGRFKRWFRAQLRKGSLTDEDFETKIMAKYRDRIDICLGDWDEKGVINTDIAVHKLDASQYMTKQELKEYPYEKVKLCKPPKMFDLSKGKRIQVSKEQLALMQQEKEARSKATI